MSLLALLRRRDAQDRPAPRSHNARRARLGLESLEGRQVMTVTYGSLMGMEWKFDYQPASRTGTLVFQDQDGSNRIFLTDQSNNDEYHPQINGIDWAVQGTNQQGGVDFLPGSHVNVVILTNAYHQNTFINAATTATMTLAEFTQAPGTVRDGNIDGLTYNFQYDGSNDSATFTITSAPGDQTYTVQQQTTFHPSGRGQKSTSNLVLVRNDGRTFTGPMVTPLTKVDIVVNQEPAANDARRNDKTDPMYYEPQDRTVTTQLDFGQGPGSTISYKERLVHDRGEWQGMKYDLVTDAASGQSNLYWVNAPGTKRIHFQTQYDGNDGTQQVTGIAWSREGSNDAGGVNFRSKYQNLSKVQIVVIERTGDNTILNDSRFTLSRRTRS